MNFLKKIPFDVRPYILERQQLKNKKFTILSANCMAAIIYHNLGLRFDTPTINLYFQADEFLKFVTDLRYYIQEADLVEDQQAGHDFPVGILGEGAKAIRIYFEHYKTFDNAKTKWEERKQRIHYDNLYIIMGEHHGATRETIENFEKLPYVHKVMVTCHDYPEFPDTFYLPHCNDQGQLSDSWATLHAIYFVGHRLFEAFNYLDFLNNKGFPPQGEPTFLTSQMNEPVSVIVPVKSQDPVVFRCLKSLAAQIYPDMEVLLAIYGEANQPDFVNQLGAALEGKVAWEKITFADSNVGLGMVLNSCIKKTAAAWVTFVDPHDCLDPDNIDHLAVQAHYYQTEIAIGSYQCTKEDTRLVINNPDPVEARYNGVYYPKEWLETSTQYLSDRIQFPLKAKLFKKTLLEQNLFPDHLSSLNRPQIFWRLCLAAQTISFNNLSSYVYTLPQSANDSTNPVLVSEINNLITKMAVLSDCPHLYQFSKELLKQKLSLAISRDDLTAHQPEYQFLLNVLQRY